MESRRTREPMPVWRSFRYLALSLFVVVLGTVSLALGISSAIVPALVLGLVLVAGGALGLILSVRELIRAETYREPDDAGDGSA